MSFTGDRKAAMGLRRPPIWARNTDATFEVAVARNLDLVEVTPTKENLADSTSVCTALQSASALPNNNRFTFFSGLTGTKTSPRVTVYQDDSLMNLDISRALFPAGTERNSFSPAAFKNLQMNATGIIQRYQAAYQQRTASLQQSAAEMKSQADEKEEAQLRIQLLKLQLEEMARKADEQEINMRSLVEELAREKKIRIDERRNRVIALSSSRCSTMSEDLAVDEDQQKRIWHRSDGSAESIISDTDAESIAEASIFSQACSPVGGNIVMGASPSETPSAYVKSSAMPAVRPAKVQPQPQPNTLQKLFRMSSAAPLKTGSCRNCQGQEASVAWDTVALLKDENKGLKERVHELEDAVEGALDAALGVGM